MYSIFRNFILFYLIKEDLACCDLTHEEKEPPKVQIMTIVDKLKPALWASDKFSVHTTFSKNKHQLQPVWLAASLHK